MFDIIGAAPKSFPVDRKASISTDRFFFGLTLILEQHVIKFSYDLILSIIINLCMTFACGTFAYGTLAVATLNI